MAGFVGSRLLSASWQAEQALLAESLPSLEWEKLAFIYLHIDNTSQILANIDASKGAIALDEEELESAKWSAETAAEESKRLLVAKPVTD
jgi:hypothetical protein